MSAPPRDLDEQADCIEQVLAAHAVTARVQGGAVSAQWVRFTLTPGVSVAVVQSLSGQLAHALGTDTVRVSQTGATLAVEVPRHIAVEAEPDLESQPVRLLPLLDSLGPLLSYTTCLGQTADGRPLLLRLTSAEVAHLLVVGSSGAGKTELMRTVLVSLALTNRQSRLQLALIDSHQRGLAPLAGLPHLLAPVASDPAAAFALLDRLMRELARRETERVSLPRIVIAIDELLPLFTAEETAGRRVTRAGYTLAQVITHLTERGHGVGLHLVLGVQRPTAAALDVLNKVNFPVRLVGRVTNADEAYLVTGQAGSGAEQLAGAGDFLVLASGHRIRFQAAWFSAQDWAQLAQTTA